MNDMTHPVIPAPNKTDGSGTAMSLILDPVAMGQVFAMAKLMSSSKVTIPKHLQGNEGDCVAIILQSARWKMDPFAVAQKTHISQSGALGYEAQIVNAVIVSCGAIEGQPEFEFLGDWNKILGRVEERKSDRGGKYYVAGWSGKDEEGLGVIITATLDGEARPRSLKLMLTQCYPRFSTQWATDPQQQITYVAVRKFARRYAPGAILGVYTKDELESEPVGEIDVTPRSEPGTTAEQARTTESSPKAKSFDQYPASRFPNMLARVRKNVDEGVSLKDAIDAAVKFIAGKNQEFSADQMAQLEAIKPSILGSATMVDDPAAPYMSFAEISDKLTKANTVDALDEACDLIGGVPDADQRRELGDLYNVRRTELEGK